MALRGEDNPACDTFHVAVGCPLRLQGEEEAENAPEDDTERTVVGVPPALAPWGWETMEVRGGCEGVTDNVLRRRRVAMGVCGRLHRASSFAAFPLLEAMASSVGGPPSPTRVIVWVDEKDDGDESSGLRATCGVCISPKHTNPLGNIAGEIDRSEPIEGDTAVPFVSSSFWMSTPFFFSFFLVSALLETLAAFRTGRRGEDQKRLGGEGCRGGGLSRTPPVPPTHTSSSSSPRAVLVSLAGYARWSSRRI